MTTDIKTNPYYDKLFKSFNEYITRNEIDSTLKTADSVTNDKLSKFIPGGLSNDAFTNIAGNYKYSCIVPKEKGIPPNYIGVLKENNALTGFMDELYSFTDFTPVDNVERAEINCTRAAERLYSKAYGTIDDKGHPQAYCINFTDGMPCELREPALREVHTDITKQLNKIIDYAIATGQTDKTEEYDKVLISHFLNMFFTTDCKPRYYALRTGILPSAISYARYLIAQKNNTSITFGAHYNDYEEEIDVLSKGLHFIPIGRSTQFLNADNDERLYWYPFNSQDPYSYKYDDSGTKDKHGYVVHEGFNHFKLTQNGKGDEALPKDLKIILNSASIETDAINNALSGNSRMVLSYESCLSDIPAPKRICVFDSYNTVVERDTEGDGTNSLYRKGNLTKTIEDIESWANIQGSDKTYSMHPLLNYSGRKGYLQVEAEQHGSNITEDVTHDPKKNTNIEELSYYETGFNIRLGTKALNRMNFYSSRKEENNNKIKKSVNPYDLEFGVVSRDLYSIKNNGKDLTLNDSLRINPDTFGVLGKLPEQSDNPNEPAWQTVKCGITSAIHDINLDTLDSNLLFDVAVNGSGDEVPKVSMNITTIHYGGPYGGEGDKNHGCNFWRDDKFAGGYDCHEVRYIETGEDYHEKSFDASPREKDFNENKTVEVKFGTTEAVLGEYNSNVVYNLSNMTMAASTIQGYYYTVHILSDDGKESVEVKINSSNGKLDVFADDNDNTTKQDRTSRYGTGLQYFFGGNCDKSIFESYWNKGLTLFQLLDPTTDAYEDINGKKYGRVINGLQYANRTFEWDYNVVLKAWYLALWIMNGHTTSNTDRKDYKNMHKEKLYTTNDAGLALAAFFDYIYSDSGIRLMIGPSLKQINNAVGPYGSTISDNEKGITTSDDNNDNYDNTTLRGASWIAIKNNTGTNRGVYDGLHDHAKVAAAVFVNSETPLFNANEGENPPAKIGRNGVGKKYWSKGDVKGTGYNDKSKRSEWGEHMADARRLWRHSDGYLHLDHYSWHWHIDNEIGGNLTAPGGYNLWHGAFMIHALNPTRDEKNPEGTNGKGYNSPFNWHLGPFHEVSPGAKEHTNEYGVRYQLVKWGQARDDGDCPTGIPADKDYYKQSWDGINNDEEAKIEYTWDNQNPNIRIRLPMLWRYLKSLREKGIYTDGQLMPCGIELHYCNYRKALMTSITNAEHTLPVTPGFIPEPKNATEVSNNNAITEKNTTSWQDALRSPSSVTFAEVLYETHAITKNTISTWYTLMNTPEYYNPLIRDILKTVAVHSDKLTAMHRTKRYIDSISNVLGNKGKILYNIPILPSISSFGITETPTDGTVNSVIFASKIGITYNVPPDFDLAGAKANNVAIGVTHQPQLPPDQTANQFTAIASAIYSDMSNFSGDTIGWIVPIPTKSNLALLNAYDGSWRNSRSSVIPLTMNTIHNTLEQLSKERLHWIGWVKSDTLPCLSSHDLKGLVHICYNENATSGLTGPDVAVVPMVSLKITPYYNANTDCNTEGDKCKQSVDTQDKCAKVTPYSFKFEIDTRGTDDSLKLIMIRDNINEIVNYTVYQLSDKVSIKPKNINMKAAPIKTYMTTVSYNKDEIDIPIVLRPL